MIHEQQQHDVSNLQLAFCVAGHNAVQRYLRLPCIQNIACHVWPLFLSVVLVDKINEKSFDELTLEAKWIGDAQRAWQIFIQQMGTCSAPFTYTYVYIRYADA